MLNATKDKQLPTAMIGSFPRPSWFTESLRSRPFKVALGDSLYREQYLDAVACYLTELAVRVSHAASPSTRGWL
jgi:hypothetical protein